MNNFSLAQPPRPAIGIDRPPTSFPSRVLEHLPPHPASENAAAPAAMPHAAEQPGQPLDCHSLANDSSDSVTSMNTKTCVKCKQEKSVVDFHKNSRSTDGLHSYCKECNRAQALAHIKAEKARKALLRAAKKAAADA
ncbi:hypothetical protein [Candidatus Accumulibacter sp. ACC003]|uniref:hypothetical protein n=1 Tax=Candidatus Accumulibacter sp. ACC003 TaxID=2823334 RepID=UPI0025BB7396|nr:hypothetical protein [Candidatus Accumulibacter sp. ACC003]